MKSTEKKKLALILSMRQLEDEKNNNIRQMNVN